MPSYKGQLTLGNPDVYDSTLCIDIERYPRTKIAVAPSASQFVTRSTGGTSAHSSATLAADGSYLAEDGPPDTGGNLTSVKSSRTYQVEDADAPGGKREVNREDLAKGYEYGRTAVHISDSDTNVTKLETHAALELIGFVPREKVVPHGLIFRGILTSLKYNRYMNLSTSSVVIAQKTNDKASMALSSFIHALFELDCYAIARLVTKNDNSPVLVLLAPSIEPDYECLLDVQLPFAEDVRSYAFPPLDRVVTVSGKTLTEHRNLPNDGLKKAMSDFVDKMDLSGFGHGVDG